MAEYKLHHGDCLEVLPTLGDGSVDVAVIDPPYGIGENNKKNLSRVRLARPVDYGHFDWDKEPVSQSVIESVLSVSKNQVIWGGNYYALPPSSGWIVWDKLNGSNDFSDCELAWTSYNRGVRKFTYMWNGMIKQKPEKRYHPTQKPLDLMLWVINNYTKPGDLVADFFMGSGTTGEACIRLGRRFIGIEKDAAYFAIAQERLARVAAQPLLIPPERQEKLEQAKF